MTRPLIELLPALYRLRDAPEAGGDGLLAAVLGAIDEAVAEQAAELADRYDDLFVETCHPDELPHVAALLGQRDLPGRREPRALLGNLIRYRRGKGTAATLEGLAGTATGWPAAVVEYFTLLVLSQHLNHLRPGRGGTVDLRDPVPLRYAGTPFDRTAHTPDVRAPGMGGGRYNLPTVGIHLWRLAPVLEADQAPSTVDSTRYRFHPLGADTALYSRGDPGAARTGPLNVTMPIGLLVARRDLAGYYPDSVGVTIDGTLVDPSQVSVCDLGDDPDTGGWRHVPPATAVAIDPERGRFALAAAPAGPVRVRWVRALPSGLGGGGYARDPAPAVARSVPVPADLAAGLAALAGADGELVLAAGAAYPVGALALAPGQAVTVRAAPGTWPLLTGAELAVQAGAGASLTLDGLLVAAPVRVTGAPAAVAVRHTTLVPGHGLAGDGTPLVPDGVSLSLDLDQDAATDVWLDHAVTGPVRGQPELATVRGTASILAGPGDGPALAGSPDGALPGPALFLDGCTVLGAVHAEILTLDDAIVTGAAVAHRQQEGRVRHSWLGPGSRPPRQVRPVGDPPVFVTTRYGHPAYCQLDPACPPSVATGAADGAEAGAFHHVGQAQRLAALRSLLDEYLRLTMTAGIFLES